MTGDQGSAHVPAPARLGQTDLGRAKRWCHSRVMKAQMHDGLELEYEVYGRGDENVLFLHGWGNAASFWDDLLTKHLNLNGLRCITASYRGRGRSSHAKAVY